MALTDRQFQQAVRNPDWRALNGGVAAWFEASSHAQGADLARAIATDRACAVDIRANGVRVFLPRPQGRFSEADVALADEVSESAARVGPRADPSVLRGYQIGIDVADPAAAAPFWWAVLGYEAVGDEHGEDPLRRNPDVWFQQMTPVRPLRDRFHLDVSRVGGLAAEAAAAAGGTYVGGPYGLLVADADGNEADLVPAGPMAESPDVSEWQALFAGMGAWRAESTRAAAEFAQTVAALADSAGLAVKLDLRGTLVIVDSGKDLWEDPSFEPFAARVQAAARDAGLVPDPTRLTFVQVVIDAADVPKVQGFWRAVLGYDDDPREGVTDLVDPRRVGPEFVFQPIEEADPDRMAQRNRTHIDLFVPDDVADELVRRAVAAGGTVVRDDPFFRTIADPEGNEIDIAVVPGRQEARD